MTKIAGKEVSLSVEELVGAFVFGPDCTVEGYLYGGSAAATKAVPKGYRLESVNGQLTTDSGELKRVLLQEAAAGVPVKAVFVRPDSTAPIVPIESSVRCNGKVSTVAKADTEKVEALVQSMRRSWASPFKRSSTKTSPSTASTAVSAFTASSSATGSPASQGPSSKAGGAVPAPPSSSSAAAAGAGAATGTTSASLAPVTRTSSAHSTRSHESDASSSSDSGHDAQSFTGSESSLADFQTVPLTKQGSSPDLLEFEKMKLSMRGDDVAQRVLKSITDLNELSVKHRLSAAMAKAKPGRCVICVTQDVNPIAELELLALASQRRLVAFDLGVKLRLRPKPHVLAKHFAEAMRTGAWFALINAHKSINTCTVFEELLTDAHSRNLDGFDPNARIIVSLEPHPHFPRALIHQAVVVKLVANFEGSNIMADSLATSMTRNRLVTADTLTASMLQSKSSIANFNASTTSGAAVQRPPKRRVRINAAVDVVDIAPREIVKASVRELPINVSGSVALFKTFCGVPGDKFLCVHEAGEPGRFAVGSSMGNVYFLDSLGNSLLQAHAHNAPIWDVDFNGKYSFATGCEDGTSASWNITAPSAADVALGGDDAALVPTSATTLGADVYSVAFQKSMRPSPLIIGGQHNQIMIRPFVESSSGDGSVTASDNVAFVEVPFNAQVIGCLPDSDVALIGGGNGVISVVDVARSQCLCSLAEHKNKVPALTVRNNSQFFTGGFDSQIISWDLRVPGGVTGVAATGAAKNNGSGSSDSVAAKTAFRLSLSSYVTGLDIDDVHMAANVGENLYIWDVRKLDTVLGGYPRCWRGVSRGVKIRSDSHLIVTASPDGFVRFWNFV